MAELNTNQRLPGHFANDTLATATYQPPRSCGITVLSSKSFGEIFTMDLPSTTYIPPENLEQQSRAMDISMSVSGRDKQHRPGTDVIKL